MQHENRDFDEYEEVLVAAGIFAPLILEDPHPAHALRVS